MDLNKFLTANWGMIISIVIAYFTLVIPIIKFLGDKRRKDKNIRFKNYHNLIDVLVGSADKTPMLDRQVVIIFELRNFPEYYPVTLRIIESAKKTWAKEYIRLIKEFELTELYINASKINRILKFRKKIK